MILKLKKLIISRFENLYLYVNQRQERDSNQSNVFVELVKNFYTEFIKMCIIYIIDKKFIDRLLT